jgi:hypothetical protein
MYWFGLCVFMSIRLAEIPAWAADCKILFLLLTAFDDTLLRLSRYALYVLLFVTNEGGTVV